MFKKLVLVTTTVATMAVGALAMTGSAEAYPYYWHPHHRHHHMMHCQVRRFWHHHHWVVRRVCFGGW